MRTLFFILAIVTLVLLIIHWSPWIYFMDDAKPLPEVWFSSQLKDTGTHYFELERTFWTALLGGFFVAFLGEALLYPRKKKRVTVVEDYSLDGGEYAEGAIERG